MPYISVLIPWANREELAYSLRENSRWFRSDDVEVILINAGGDERQLGGCIADLDFRGLRIIALDIKSFNKSLALNLGVHFSRGNVLCILDADIILRSDFLSEATPMLETGAFVTIRKLYESGVDSPSQFYAALSADPGYISSVRRVYSIEVTFLDGSTTSLTTSASELLTGSNAGHGQVLMRKADFLAIAGYHSELETWGWEDDDLLFRFRRVLGLIHCEAGEATHLTHGDERRTLYGNSKASSNRANMIRCLQRYAKQHFRGSYFEDSAKWAAMCSERDLGLNYSSF